MTKTQLRLTALMFLAGFGAVFYFIFPSPSPDLMATWLAGSFLNSGQPDQVYGTAGEMFRMYPPSQWRAYMAENYNYTDAVYPFLYPPIWAKVGQWLAYFDYWRFSAVSLAINSALIFATVFLAWRASRTRLNPVSFMALAVLFLFSNYIGMLALLQNQPQILVSFLVILAVERARNGSEILAGAALALAAAIKIYPALFALLWLAGGERRALASFAVFGMTLGLVSIAWAGWPLHIAFLEQLRTISNSVLVTRITLNIDAAVAQTVFRDDLVRVPALEAPAGSGSSAGWYSMVRPIWWQIGSPAALVVAIGALMRLYARSDDAARTTAVWPLALTVIPLLLPIAWPYYYIPAACLAPALLDRLGGKLGALILLAGFGPIFTPIAEYFRMSGNADGFAPYPFQLLAVAALITLAAGFHLAARPLGGNSWVPRKPFSTN